MTAARTTSPVGRWDRLYRLLVDPTATAYALRRPAADARANEAVRERVTGARSASTLIEVGEQRSPTGAAVWAVVAPIRADLIAVDVDGAADTVLPALLHAAEIAGCELVHLAASGSDESVHAVWAPRGAAGRARLEADVDEIRAWAGRSGTELAILGARPVRLPGSASLKAGRTHCWPIDLDGRPMSPAAAADRAAAALVHARMPLDPADAPTPQVDAERRPPGRILIGPAPATPASGSSIDESTAAAIADSPSSQPPAESPRAWRRTPKLSDDDWRQLMAAPPAGADRSAIATAAAWILWRHGVRSVAAAAWWYRRCPAFTKFSGSIERIRTHWTGILARTRQLAPAVTLDDQAVIDAVHTEIRWWSDHTLAAAAAHTIAHRYADGYGITQRPIAVRDLASWMGVAITSAAGLLAGLVDRGVLINHGQANPRAASTYTLTVPSSLYRGGSAHDVTSPPALHPCWGPLSHALRACWRLLLLAANPLTTATLTLSCGLPPSTVLRLLRFGVTCGLVRRVGYGRATTWTAGAATIEQAAALTGATARVEEIRRDIVAERLLWHQNARPARARANRRVHRPRRRPSGIHHHPGLTGPVSSRRGLSHGRDLPRSVPTVSEGGDIPP